MFTFLTTEAKAREVARQTGQYRYWALCNARGTLLGYIVDPAEYSKFLLSQKSGFRVVFWEYLGNSWHPM